MKNNTTKKPMKIEEQVEDLLHDLDIEDALIYCDYQINYNQYHRTKEGLIYWTKVKLRLEELKNKQIHEY